MFRLLKKRGKFGNLFKISTVFLRQQFILFCFQNIPFFDQDSLFAYENWFLVCFFVTRVDIHLNLKIIDLYIITLHKWQPCRQFQSFSNNTIQRKSSLSIFLSHSLSCSLSLSCVFICFDCNLKCRHLYAILPLPFSP